MRNRALARSGFARGWRRCAVRSGWIVAPPAAPSCCAAWSRLPPVPLGWIAHSAASIGADCAIEPQYGRREGPGERGQGREGGGYGPVGSGAVDSLFDEAGERAAASAAPLA